MAERLRGRRGVEQRRRRLQAEPLCRDCKAKGVITAATAPDHIVPLALGGSDDDSNVRCLCTECHLERTREQFGHRARVTMGEAEIGRASCRERVCQYVKISVVADALKKKKKKK